VHVHFAFIIVYHNGDLISDMSSRIGLTEHFKGTQNYFGFDSVHFARKMDCIFVSELRSPLLKV